MKTINVSGGGTTTVDDEDYAWVCQRKWKRKVDGYIVRSQKVGARTVEVRLHQAVIGVRDGFVVDHINGDRSDNRRCNLRHVTLAGNSWNRRAFGTSGRKGVTLHRKTGRWQAMFSHRYLGLFKDIDAAARAYDAAAFAVGGGLAKLNFPEEYAAGSVTSTEAA